ncbi:MAG: A/G-specific adenine glycosylase [Candidatus Omnitrophica bacterium]|nr:A/G-specific adenine glycosylase [Candidatus Omnitrophota bacterium]
MTLFQKNLSAWYQKNARKDLPWRKTRDPYRIWVSETMLQQTQVSTVIPYYQKFLKKFPSVETLAKAPLTAVLDSWSGLGYYFRAKNLHSAAQEIVSRHNGRLPRETSELLKLPGIGRYTAGAVASIAYDRPAPILDGNVIRVLCRYFGIRQDPREAPTQKKLWELSQRLVPSENPGDFNQAMMELGALVCTPRAPACPACPIRSGCRARKLGLQEKIPPPRLTPERKRIRYLCGILEDNEAVLLARRPMSGLLPGLWEFPGGERKPKETESESLTRNFRERLGIDVIPGEFKARIRQTLSHRELEIRAFACRRRSGGIRPRWYTESRWIPKDKLDQVAFTAGMSKLAVGMTTLLLAGCATVAPIDQGEVKSAQEFYQVKSLRHVYDQTLRVRIVGEQIVAALPPQEIQPGNPQPNIGVLLDDLTLTSGRVFGVSGIESDHKSKRGCLVVGVIPNGPSSKAGLKPGDLLLRVGEKETPSVNQAVNAFRRLKPAGRFKPNDSVSLLLEREGVRFERTLTVESKRYPVHFQVEDDPQVNAYAGPGQIVVTTGLLRFIVSDDELAVVMAHELAHLTKGHIAKGMGTGIVSGLLGNIIGGAIDIVLPGVGGTIGQAASAGVQAPFSQDFEREADYVGLKYAYRAGYRIEAGVDFWDRFATELPQSISHSFFNTHPTSPERLLRMKKAIQEIRSQPK